MIRVCETQCVCYVTSSIHGVFLELCAGRIEFKRTNSVKYNHRDVLLMNRLPPSQVGWRLQKDCRPSHDFISRSLSEVVHDFAIIHMDKYVLGIRAQGV